MATNNKICLQATAPKLNWRNTIQKAVHRGASVDRKPKPIHSYDNSNFSTSNTESNNNNNHYL